MAANSSETSSQLAWDKELNDVPCVDPWGIAGAYSTIRVDGEPPRPLFLEDHLARLADSLERMGMASPVDRDQIGERIHSFSADLPLAAPYLLRVSVLEEGFQAEARSLPTIGPWIEGRLLPYVRPTPEAKSLDKLLYDQVSRLNRATEEALLLAPDGGLGEGSTSNLIFARGEVLVIPETNVLPGITLAKLLPELSARHTIERRAVHLTDLPEFTEILATGSGKEVVAFARIPEVGWNARSEEILWTARDVYAEIKRTHLASSDA